MNTFHLFTCGDVINLRLRYDKKKNIFILVLKRRLFELVFLLKYFKYILITIGINVLVPLIKYIFKIIFYNPDISVNTFERFHVSFIYYVFNVWTFCIRKNRVTFNVDNNVCDNIALCCMYWLNYILAIISPRKLLKINKYINDDYR